MDSRVQRHQQLVRCGRRAGVWNCITADAAVHQCRCREGARGVQLLTGRLETMAKVTGIGGVFLKSKGDSAALAAWYRKHLGMQLEEFGGAILRWPDDKAEDKGLTVWHLADKDSKWFSPSNSSFMI